MAWEDVTYKCGHTGRVRMAGKYADRERRIAWIAENEECPECKAKKNDEVNRLAAEKAAEAGLPELTGTPKQIAWANTLRNKAIECIDSLVKKNMGGVMHPVIKRAFDLWIETETTAEYWIDNKNYVDKYAQDLIKPYIKKAVEEQTEVKAEAEAETEEVQAEVKTEAETEVQEQEEVKTEAKAEEEVQEQEEIKPERTILSETKISNIIRQTNDVYKRDPSKILDIILDEIDVEKLSSKMIAKIVDFAAMQMNYGHNKVYADMCEPLENPLPEAIPERESILTERKIEQVKEICPLAKYPKTFEDILITLGKFVEVNLLSANTISEIMILGFRMYQTGYTEYPIII